MTIDGVGTELPVGIETDGGTKKLYAVDWEQTRRRTIALTREPQDTGAEQSDASLNTEGPWRRSQTDWRDGMGQADFDDADSSRARMDWMVALEWWNERVLQPSVAAGAHRLSGVDLGGEKVVTTDTRVVFAHDDTVEYEDYGGVTSWASFTGLAAGDPVALLETDGQTVYVHQATVGIKRWLTGASAPDGAFTSAGDCDLIVLGNGVMVIANGASLYSVGNTGTRTLIWTHHQSNFRWTAGCSAPNGLYIAGKLGSTPTVYHLTIDPETGAISVPTVATPYPGGEVVSSILFHAGLLVLGGRGIRLAQINGDNTITYGQRITLPPAYTEEFTSERQPPYDVTGLAADGDRVYFTWGAYLPDESNIPWNHTTGPVWVGLGILDLGRFIEPLVPAWGPGPMELLDNWTGDLYCADVAVAHQDNDKPTVYFTVNNKALYYWMDVEDFGNRHQFGYAGVGKVRMGTNEAKRLSALTARHSAHLVGQGLSIDVEADTAANIANLNTGTDADAGDTETAGLVDDNQRTIAFDVYLSFNSGGEEETPPALYRWLLEGVVDPGQKDELIVALQLNSHVRTLVPSDRHFSVKSEYEFLRQLKDDKEFFTFWWGQVSARVYIDRIEEVPEEMADDGSYTEGVVVLRMLTV